MKFYSSISGLQGQSDEMGISEGAGSPATMDMLAVAHTLGGVAHT